MLHKEAVSPELLILTKKLQALKELEKFHLVGGTALALHLGHRTSVDIDLFSDKSVDKKKLKNALSYYFSVIGETRSTGFGLLCIINNIKVDFCWDGGKFIRPPINEIGISLASLEDISAMKLGAITNRASQKDFYDIAVLTEKFSIKEMIRFYREKFIFMDPREPIDSLKKHYLASEENPVHSLIPLTWQEATDKLDKAYNIFISDLKTAKQKQIEERLKTVEKLIAKKKK